MFKSLVTQFAVLGTLLSPAVFATSISSVNDVQSMTIRADGKYDVICKSGTHEVATAEQIHYNEVCGGNTTQTNHEVEAVFARPEGDYFVLCKSKAWEVATADSIAKGTVCGGVTQGPICATSDANYVHFQIPAAATAKVECFYSGPQNGSFNAATVYSTATGRWTCPNWSKGNPQYKINLKVDGADHFTDEKAALANPCH